MVSWMPRAEWWTLLPYRLVTSTSTSFCAGARRSADGATMLLVMRVWNMVEVLRYFYRLGFLSTTGNSPLETFAPGLPGFTCILLPSQTKLFQFGGAAMYCKMVGLPLHCNQYLQFFFWTMVCWILVSLESAFREVDEFSIRRSHQWND